MSFPVDEYSFVSAPHLAAMSSQVAKGARQPNLPFGGRHVTLIGDPCQHSPPASTPLHHQPPAESAPPGAVRASKALASIGANLYQNDFSTVVLLTEQQRTPCPKLYKYSRMFARLEQPTWEEVAEFCDALNSRVVPSIDAIDADIVRTVVLRNEVRHPLNWRLASRHAKRCHARPIAWRAVDTCTARSNANAAQQQLILDAVKLLPAADTGDMNPISLFFEGCLYTFIDNDAPTLGVAKNATCVGRGLLLHPDEPCDPHDGDIWWLQYPPHAMFVQPLDVKVSDRARAALLPNYPTLPEHCIVVPAKDVTFPVTCAGQCKVTVRRHNLPLGDGYVVTDYYCQGASFKKDPWLSHLSVPPTGPLSRASLYVVTSWHAEWGDVRLLTPLWVEGERGWSE